MRVADGTLGGAINWLDDWRRLKRNPAVALYHRQPRLDVVRKLMFPLHRQRKRSNHNNNSWSPTATLLLQLLPRPSSKLVVTRPSNLRLCQTMRMLTNLSINLQRRLNLILRQARGMRQRFQLLNQYKRTISLSSITPNRLNLRISQMMEITQLCHQKHQKMPNLKLRKRQKREVMRRLPLLNHSIISKQISLMSLNLRLRQTRGVRQLQQLK
mmetsp:Transcript_19554/g.33609  ORF Transcript_19554/g.33609 Transcript_19554/m.33609 type:complete len:213 (+) Transcript_19554:630-1268(+)